jgi:hypothetical protein
MAVRVASLLGRSLSRSRSRSMQQLMMMMHRASMPYHHS